MAPDKYAPTQQESCTAPGSNRSWLSRRHKNQPQWNALGSVSFILISGGMSLAWGAGFAVHSAHLMTFHMEVSWYAAATLGAIIGALCTHRLPQQPVYIICSCLVLISGILFLVCHEHPEAIITARYLDGLANGLVFVPAMSTVGEISVCDMRGLLAATVEQLSCNTGILMQLLYTAVWQVDWNVTIAADQVHGVLSIVYGLVALALASTLCVESPVSLLLRANEQQAVAALRHLQRPYMVTSETLLQLDEHKHYVATNRGMSLWQSIRMGLPPLLKLLAHRSLNALCLTLVVWSALYETAVQVATHYHAWPYVIFGVMRWSGCFCVLFLMDSTGRKKPTLFGCFSCGSFALAFATLFGRTPHMKAALGLLFSLQFFAGLGQTASAVYLTEAFPLAIKPHYVAIVYVMELLLRFIFCSFAPSPAAIVAYFYVLGGLSMAFFFLGIFCLPETRLTTLTEAQQKFSKWFNKDF
ncbi:uncharacterized protein LOC117580520 [Drosophila guanche]|uniref:Blast:Solute carrier family 2, facilitated glucose transporter member 8 n=1 Tax=Drosophila guanche TaxID=7266 RepID=A0A3B0JMH0_DROGU|nr:uncharacterized protein LOC117580520 [Drosophila guanche]SPP76660.1 blast:Solute carrier family 2%2C facilitated glucose transporter member 8 [Drosophila guanche]